MEDRLISATEKKSYLCPGTSYIRLHGKLLYTVANYASTVLFD